MLSFARPDLLSLMFLLPILSIIGWLSGRRRRTLLQSFGRSESIAALSSLKPRRRLLSRLCLFFTLTFLIFGLCGPRWGKDDSGVVVGRDLMIVLDLSKSMLAEDMRDPTGQYKERWQAASASIRDLVESIAQRGGHRVGLVVFAAKPWLVCPLTADYDHFLMRLDEFASPDSVPGQHRGGPLAPPAETNPGPNESIPSGTRIGAALVEAVNAHDARFPGYQDILLISDGDDPHTEDRDREIEAGIRAAQDAKIPVYVAGVGDPETSSQPGYTRANGNEELVGPTKLEEAPLKEIARQTRGEYLPARRDRPDLTGFFQTRIEPRASRELSDDALPQPHDRAVWFFIPAVVFLLAAWIIEP